MINLETATLIPLNVSQCFKFFQCVFTLKGDTILTTEGLNVATLYDKTTFVPIKSWSFPQSSPLSCPVVYDELSAKFVALLDSTTIKKFDVDTTESSESKLKFVDPISCIIPAETEPIVVFKSGYIATLSDAVTERKTSNKISAILKNNSEIVYGKALSQDSQRNVAAVLAVKTSQDKYELHFVTADKNQKSFIKHKKVKLDNVVCFTINSHGLVAAVSTRNNIFRVMDGVITKDYDLPECVTNVSSIAMFPQNPYFVAVSYKDSTSSTITLQIIDTRVKSVNFFETPHLPNPNGLYIYEDVILMACTKGLTVVPYALETISLSQTFGKSTSDEQKQVVTESLVSEYLKKLTKANASTIMTELTKLQEHLNLQLVSEKVIAKTVHRLLNEKDFKLQERQEVMEHLLLISINDKYLTHELREEKFTIEETLVLLECLTKKLELRVDSNYTVSVLDWITILFDAYFKQIVLSLPQFESSLIMLQERLDNFTEAFGVLESLKNVIGILMHEYRNKDIVTYRENNYKSKPQYSIEVVML